MIWFSKESYNNTHESPKKIVGLERLQSESSTDVIFCITLSERANYDGIQEEIEETYGAYIAEQLVKSGLMVLDSEQDNISMSTELIHDQNGIWKIILTYTKA